MKNSVLFFLMMVIVCGIACENQENKLEQNKEIARIFFKDALEKLNMSSAEKIIGSDCKFYLAGELMEERGLVYMQKTIDEDKRAFDDLKVQIKEMVAESDIVAVDWQFSAFHKGEMLGLPPTHNNISWNEISRPSKSTLDMCILPANCTANPMPSTKSVQHPYLILNEDGTNCVPHNIAHIAL